MNNIALQKKIKIANKLSIYFYNEDDYWYFYDKNTYSLTVKQYEILCQYTIDEMFINKKELSDHKKYEDLALCLAAALRYFSLESQFDSILKQRNNKSLYQRLKKLIPLKPYNNFKYKI